MAFKYLSLAILITLISQENCLGNAELKCSQFDFQERLLEKVVRLEHSSELESLKADLANAKNEITTMKEKMAELEAGKPGPTYVRWGRTSCPGNGSEDIYSGFAGGSFFTHTGAAADMVCLPKDPTWEKYDDTLQNGGFMYGAEYDDRAYGGSRESKITGTNHWEQEVPCAVCNLQLRSSVIMIPGRSECYPGWTLEFWGYLMSGYFDHKAASNYYCVDADQEAIVGRGKNDNGYLLNFVEGRCGSLACPPYVNGHELTCVVCSK